MQKARKYQPKPLFLSNLYNELPNYMTPYLTFNTKPLAINVGNLLKTS